MDIDSPKRTCGSKGVVAFIGLGVMGRPMAANLLAANYPLRVYSRSSIPTDLVKLGAVACESASQASESADFIITMVQDSADVEQVLFGSSGVRYGIGTGAIIIDMSSISPTRTREFAKKIRDLGGDYLDAPVSGGDVGAKNGTLTIMVGGDAKSFNLAKPIFDVLGQTITHIGDVGSGQVCKLANQVVVASNIQAVGEALLLATAAGVDPARVREALLGGFAGSKVMDIHGDRILQRNFEPGFRADLHLKDMNNVIATATDLGIALPAASATTAIMNATVKTGNGCKDSSALVQVLEHLNGITITKPK